jgi:hypothetical protein
MVASDAVGMGLNLNINRVVFNSVDKFDGQRVVQLSAGQIKQIAGRAGRYNSKIIADDMQQDLGGTVTAMSSADLEIIRQCVEMPADRLQPVNRVGLQPTADIINEFASYYPQLPLATLLDKFQEMARVDGDYFLCQLDDAKGLADQLQPIDMPIEERFQFTMAPVRLQDQLEVECIQALAGARDRRLEGERKRNANRARRGYSVLDIPLIKRSLVGGSPRSASELTAVYRQCLNASELHGLMAVEEEMEPVVRLLKQAWQPAQTHYGLTQYERLHRVVTLYNWLHYRFPETYQSATMAGLIKRFLEQLIDESLFKMHSVSRFSADTNPSINIDQLLLSKLKF